MRLADKSIVVTGATGIAAAGARRSSAEGARIFVISLDEDDCRGLVSSIEGEGGMASYAVADLTVEAEAESALERAVGSLGAIDGIFAVAGASGRRFGDGPAHEVTLSGWAETLEINTHPMLLATRLAIDSMRGRGGSVVVVSSVLAESPSPHPSNHRNVCTTYQVENGPGYLREQWPGRVYSVARIAESGRRPERGTRFQGRITVNPVKSTFQLEPVS